MFGVALIIVGAIFLLKGLGLLSMFQWDLIWPVVLIVIGILMVFKRR